MASIILEHTGKNAIFKKFKYGKYGQCHWQNNKVFDTENVQWCLALVYWGKDR